MPLIVIPQRFSQRIDTASAWTAKNALLWVGEIAFETDDEGDVQAWKVGDGVTRWNALDYFGGTAAPVEMRATATHIQYRNIGDPIWTDLVALEELEGPPGPPSTVPGPPGADGTRSGQFLFGGGDRIGPGSVTLGPKHLVPVTFDGVITAAQLHITTADGLPGSISIEVWKCDYATFGAARPDATDKITAAAPPTVTGGFKSQDTTLTGWSDSFVAGDVLTASVVSRSVNVNHFALALLTEKTS